MFFYLIIFTTFFSNSLQSDDCGRVFVNATTTNSTNKKGAEDTYKGQWPWHVPVFYDQNYICGSTLISQKHLLTAAHCIAHDENVKNYFVLPGRFNLSNDKENFWINRTITKMFIHEEFNLTSSSFRSDSDIGILVMSSMVIFNDFIFPICLPKPCNDVNEFYGTVVGHIFSNNESSFLSTLKMATFHAIESKKCIFKHRKYSKIVSEKSFCAISPVASPCAGDSGGGFFVKNNDTEQFSIQGIISQKNNKIKCPVNDFTVFVDVSGFVHWIQSKILTKIIDFCDIQPSPCGPNSKCINLNGNAFCTCQVGFLGSPPNCKEPECFSNQECSVRKNCIKNECVNLCQFSDCGENSECVVKNHKMKCKSKIENSLSSVKDQEKLENIKTQKEKLLKIKNLTEICLEPLQLEKCNEFVINNQESQICAAFYYGRCEGLKNHSETKEDCEKSNEVKKEVLFKIISTLTAYEGETVVLNCLSNLTKAKFIIWKLNGTELNTNKGKYFLNSYGNLLIDELNKTDEGKYSCKGFNENEENFEGEITLIVEDQIGIKAFILNETDTVVIANVSQTVTLYCAVGGFPKPFVTWWHDERILHPKDQNTRIGVINDHSLVIEKVELNDSGEYMCKANNFIAKFASVVFHLKVKSSTSFYLPPDCTDNKNFAKCALIIKGNYCNHKYYAKICCRSCTLAGKLRKDSESIEYV